MTVWKWEKEGGSTDSRLVGKLRVEKREWHYKFTAEFTFTYVANCNDRKSWASRYFLY